MEFTPYNFVENLAYMGSGMLAIMVVIGTIILVTGLLTKLFTKKDK